MKKFLVCLPAVLFILLSVFILSCEVGLGESVDTEAPKISITYPDANYKKIKIRTLFLVSYGYA